MVGARLSERGKQAGARPPRKDAPRKRAADDKSPPSPDETKADPDIAESAGIEPPPEVGDREDTLSPEEADRIRKRYLLKRFWISARGFWGRHGNRIAWVGSLGLLVLIVVNIGVQYGINI